MVMADYFIHDRLQELWQQINHLHLTYLDTEDSPQKIEQRNKLEGCIREYLCLAPHNRRFCCQETAEVLHRSASSKKDFSGYRAALGWNAISMYAGNLLSQPWRKEYRTIKTYCGFYKHQIDANLAGAEAMFEAMGYKYCGNGILVLEGPVCPDRVTNVSQDSIVAFVECQILKTIWEEVVEVSWLDVLEFRENHLCSPEQSIRMLNYRLQERRYQEQNRTFPQGTETYSTVPRYGVTVNNHSITPHVLSHAPPITGMHSFPPPSTNHSDHLAHPHPDHSHLPHAHPDHSHITDHSHHIGHAHHPHLHNLYVPITSHVQPCPAQCIYGNPYYNYSTYAPVVPANHYPRFNSITYPMCPPKSCNGYNYPNGCVPPPVYACPVPTGQLIELEGNQNGVYDTPDGIPKQIKQHDYLESHKQLAKSTNLDSLTLSKSKEDGAGTFESWDYVYRNLESQGYSKDLGERGDVLQSESRKKSTSKKTKPSIELEDAFNSLNLNSGNSNDHNLKVNEAVKRYEMNNKPEPEINSKVPQSNSYDNITTQETYTNHKSNPPSKSVSNGIGKTKTLPRDKLNLVSPEKPSQTLDTKKLRKQDIDKTKSFKETKESTKKRETVGGNWNCNACTYLNSPSVEICVICGKSKKSIDITMAVGGPQCPVCTLVNPKDVNNCQACNSSLLNSPTYI